MQQSSELTQYLENVIKPIDSNLYNDVNQLIKIDTNQVEIVKFILQRIYKIEWFIIQTLKSICTDIDKFTVEVFGNCLKSILETAKAKVQLIQQSSLIKTKDLRQHLTMYAKICMAIKDAIENKIVDIHLKIQSQMIFASFYEYMEDIFGCNNEDEVEDEDQV